MNKISFEDFYIGELFTVIRGKRIVKDRDYYDNKNNEFSYPVITSTTMNNGVDGYYNDYNCKGNTIVCGGEASGMYATYQEHDCWVMDRCRIFIPKKNVIINKYIALYFCTLFKSNQYRYSYGRSANPNEIEKLLIKLPVNQDKIVDFEYIENYIKDLWMGIPKTNVEYSECSIDAKKWREFTISDIFDIKTGKDLIYSTLDSGNYDVIGHGKVQLGVTAKTEFLDNYPLFDNNSTISLADRGNFYASVHPKPFYIGTRVKALISKYKCNIKSLMFISTIINKEEFRHSYGRNSTDKLPNLIIKLPVDSQDNPDFEFMSAYIEKLQYSDYI